MGNKNSHSDHHSRAPRNADEAGEDPSSVHNMSFKSRINLTIGTACQEDGERSMSLKDRLRAASDSAAASGQSNASKKKAKGKKGKEKRKAINYKF